MRRSKAARRLIEGVGVLLAVGLSIGSAWAAPGGGIEVEGKAEVELGARIGGEALRDAAQWRLIGDRHLSAGEAVEARAAWRSALALAPDDLGLLDRVARVEAQVGDWQQAVYAERALVEALGARAVEHPERVRVDLMSGARETLAQNHERHLAMLSSLAVLAGDFTTAEEAAHALVRRAPDAVAGHLALGHLHLHTRELDASIDAYEAALAIDPDHPTALNNLGAARYMQQDLTAAEAWYEAVLGSAARTPYSESVALANLGELHQLGARYDAAEYLYREAIDALPGGAWSYMGLAALLDVTGRYDAAIDAMIDGWERDGRRLTRLNMHFFEPEWAWQRDAMIAEIEGDVDAAIALWSKVARGDVAALRRPAKHHLASLEALLD